MSVYCSQSDVEFFLSAQGLTARLDDLGTQSSAGQTAPLTAAIAYAGSVIDMYCAPLYNPAQMVNSPIVKDWAVIIASRWLCARRSQPIPQGVQDFWEETKTWLQQVRDRQMTLPDCVLRRSQMPRWSNVRLDARYVIKQVRVERPISEGTPTQAPQAVDWDADRLQEL